MNLSNNLPHGSIFKGRYGTSREEAKFPIGIKIGFGKINICTQTVTVLKSYLRQREGSVFSAIESKRKKEKMQDNKQWSRWSKFSELCVGVKHSDPIN